MKIMLIGCKCFNVYIYIVCIQRAANAFKVAVTTVRRITRRVADAHASGTRITTPRKRRPKRSQIRYSLDTLTADAIRRQIYKMHSESK